MHYSGWFLFGVGAVAVVVYGDGFCVRSMTVLLLHIVLHRCCCFLVLSDRPQKDAKQTFPYIMLNTIFHIYFISSVAANIKRENIAILKSASCTTWDNWYISLYMHSVRNRWFQCATTTLLLVPIHPFRNAKITVVNVIGQFAREINHGVCSCTDTYFFLFFFFCLPHFYGDRFVYLEAILFSDAFCVMWLLILYNL